MAYGRGVYLVLVLVLVLVASVAAPARAQAVPSAELQAQMTARFVLAEPKEVVETRLAAALEEAVAPMSFLIRPIARSRLGRVVVFCSEYRLGLSAIEVSTTCDARPAIKRKVDNSEGKLSGLDDEPVDVAVEVAQDSVALTFKAGDGGRTTRYRFDGNGGMEIAVQVRSPQLEKPIEWKIRYRRSDAQPAK